jgi:hypothetical protein
MMKVEAAATAATRTAFSRDGLNASVMVLILTNLFKNYSLS